MAQINPVQVEKYLKGLDYPVSKQDIIKQAEKQGADKNIHDALEKLPEQNFDSPTSVSKAISKINQGKGA